MAPHKRQKVDDVPGEKQIPTVSRDLFSSSDQLKEDFSTSEPYRHCVFRSFCDPETLDKVRAEVLEHLPANLKETDLFKVYQTVDIANLDATKPENASRLPNLFALREAIYSLEFRQLVQKVTGCKTLTDQTDCSANVYSQGCHLLCHDDVIGDRCVSYIIYLTDPGWEVKDGGALELYPLTAPGKQGLPALAPTTNLLPEFNTMALFAVLPGASYHAVQEVFSDKPRLSISGWYHAADPPEGAEGASLMQLQSLAEDCDLETAGEFQTA
eukprot:gene27019-33236_t